MFEYFNLRIPQAMHVRLAFVFAAWGSENWVVSLTRPQRVQQQQTRGLLRGKEASMAAWHFVASAKVRVVVSISMAQLLNALQTSLTWR